MTSKRKKATIDDVAKLAGVDRAVVSKVLRSDPSLRVRDETRQRVLDAADKLRYRPNIHARRLSTGKTGTFGLLIPDFRNPVFADLIAGAEAVAYERDMIMWVASSDGYGTTEYASVLGGGLVDALLIAGVREDNSLDEMIGESDVPTLMVNRRSPDADRWVILEDEAAASLATHHLIELGHRSVGYVGGPAWADTASRRFDGFHSAMRAAGLDFDESRTVAGDYTPAGGVEAVQELLTVGAPPTGLVVANALTALGVWKALVARGIAVPEDVSIVGIHQLPLEEHRVHNMTCVRLPLGMLGRRAAELVLDTPASESIHEVVSDQLVVAPGATTGPPRST